MMSLDFLKKFSAKANENIEKLAKALSSNSYHKTARKPLDVKLLNFFVIFNSKIFIRDISHNEKGLNLNLHFSQVFLEI